MSITRRLFRSLLPCAGRLRLAVYFTTVFLAASLLAARALRAHVGEAALAFGRELAGLSELTVDAEALTVNGHRFRHASALTSDGVPVVLDRLQGHCRANPGLLAGALIDLARTQPAALEENAAPGALRYGVLRNGDEERGVVICFVDRQAGTLEDLIEAARRLEGAPDLASFGGLIYAYAERQKGGQTHVVTLWTETGLDLARLFPAAGDAGGEDSRVLPRPDGSRRILAAAADGMPFGLRQYETSSPLASVRSFYDVWMANQGWQRIAHPDAASTTAYLRADGYQAFLDVSAENGLTYVTAIEAGRRDGPSIASQEVKE